MGRGEEMGRGRGRDPAHAGPSLGPSRRLQCGLYPQLLMNVEVWAGGRGRFVTEGGPGNGRGIALGDYGVGFVFMKGLASFLKFSAAN